MTEGRPTLPSEYMAAEKAEASRFASEYPDGRKVLVVGGAGYIGGSLCADLLDRGVAVRCLDALLYGNRRVVEPLERRRGFEFMAGDLCDKAVLERAFDGATDVVILAGLVGDPITKKFPEASKTINEDGIQRLIQSLAKRRLNKAVFVSTCSNYGLIQGDVLASETHELKPLSLYAKAKVAAEEAVLSLKGRTGSTPVILRFATAFGLAPRMRFDLTVNEFARELALGNTLVVYDADTWRPYCHVRDFCRLIRRVLSAPRERVAFETFNAGGEANNFTKRGIVELAQKHAQAGRVEYKDHGSDPRNYKVDFSKVRNALHFEPLWSVDDGVKEVVAAVRAGRFDGHDEDRGFYGNYALEYAGAQR